MTASRTPIPFMHVPPMPVAERAQQVMVPMRDRIELATDIYLPEGQEPVGVILTRGPYDKNGPIMRVEVLAELANERGYAFVAQDVRGKFRSEGRTLPWVHEVNDGYDTIDWIAQQSWSQGRVAMTGMSYLGYTQWAALSANHPALRAIAPRATSTEFGEIGWGPGEPPITFGMQYAVDFFSGKDIYFRLTDYDWTRRPLVHEFEDAAADFGHWAPAMQQNLSERGILHRYPEGHPLDAKPIPVLHSLGLLDPFCAPEGMRDYRALVAKPEWRESIHLRLMPYDHNDSFSEDPPLPPEERTGAVVMPVATLEEIRVWFSGELDFFDRHVKGDDTVPDAPSVEYQLVRDEEVRRTTAWPPPGATARILHLAPAAGGEPGGLQAEPVKGEQEVSWNHDQDNLVPVSLRNWPSLVLTPPEYGAVIDHPDTLVFQSAPPQEEPLELAGPVTVHAQVETTGPEMDLFVHLLDREPDGTLRYITRGQKRFEAAEPTDIRVVIADACYLVRPGHALVLVLASSDYPEFLPTTGTSRNYWFATEMVKTTQSLKLGGPAGARLGLTVL